MNTYYFETKADSNPHGFTAVDDDEAIEIVKCLNNGSLNDVVCIYADTYTVWERA